MFKCAIVLHLGVSRTLPRKLSFSSSTQFSTSGRLTNATAPTLVKKRTGGSTQFLWTPSAGSTFSLSGNAAAPTPSDVTAGEAAPLTHQGHVLQRIQFRVPAFCDLCKRSCWHVLSPPPALQCIHCQVSAVSVDVLLPTRAKVSDHKRKNTEIQLKLTSTKSDN